MEDLHLDDFTEKEYRHLLEVAKKNSCFGTYEEVLSAGTGIVWRHDVDISPQRALALAKIENEEKVKAYYFILLHSTFYNILERNITLLFKEIKKCGGVIGLHFDPSYWGIKFSEEDKLKEKILFEIDLLEKLIDSDVRVVSFHNPDVGGDWVKLNIDDFGGVLNVYGPRVNKQFEYCSDSNGYWRYQRLEDLLRNSTNRKLHILTHPVWWQKEVMYPYERVVRCIEGRAKNVLDDYSNTLNENGRLNIMRP